MEYINYLNADQVKILTYFDTEINACKEIDYYTLGYIISIGCPCYVLPEPSPIAEKMCIRIFSALDLNSNNLKIMSFEKLLNEIIKQDLEGLVINNKWLLPISSIYKLLIHVDRSRQVDAYIREINNMEKNGINQPKLQDINDFIFFPKTEVYKRFLIDNIESYDNPQNIVELLLYEYDLTYFDLIHLEANIRHICLSKTLSDKIVSQQKRFFTKGEIYGK